jgi:hypothetical protein
VRKRRGSGGGRAQVSLRVVGRGLAFESWLLAGKSIFTCKRCGSSTDARAFEGRELNDPGRQSVGEAGRAECAAGNRQVRQDYSARSGTDGSYWWLCAVACGQPGYLKLSHFKSFDMASEQ